jgi:hypothetical protein
MLQHAQETRLAWGGAWVGEQKPGGRWLAWER